MDLYEKLDKQLEAKGFLTIKSRLEEGTPLDGLMSHNDVVDMDSFISWVKMEYAECMAAVARCELNGDEVDDFLAGKMSVAWAAYANLRKIKQGVKN